MTFYVRVGGSWETISDNSPTDTFQVKINGSWRQIEDAHVRVGGTWRKFYSRDRRGPAAVTNLTVTWNHPNAELTWTAPEDPDFDYVEIYRVRNPDAGTGAIYDGFVKKVDGRPGENMSWTDTNVIDNFMVYEYILYSFDATYNDDQGGSASARSMEWTGSPRGRVPNPYTFRPIDSGTQRSGAWRTDSYVQSSTGTYTRVLQGAFEGGSQNQGFYFYGSSIYDTLRGTDISAMELYLERTYGQGLGADFRPHLNWHAATSRTGSLTPYDGEVAISDLCYNGDCPSTKTYDLPPSWYANFVDPLATTRARGVTLQQVGSSSIDYGGVKSYDESNSGSITIYHSG